MPQPSAPSEPTLLADSAFDHVVFNSVGLVPAIVQDVVSREVLMMAWMNAESLQMTLAEGRTVFWSRSREELWRKGDTSGDRQFVKEAFYDCDGDTLLFIVEQEGRGACHTGERSCFYRPFDNVTVGNVTVGNVTVGNATVGNVAVGRPA